MRTRVARRKQGFTLIELMLVIAIIAIIAAIAIPNLLRSRAQTNEAAAIENLRTVCSAEISFNAQKNHFGDFAALTSEVDGQGLAFLRSPWAEGVEKQGYKFSMPTANESTFECYADPAVPGTTGVRYFRIDASGIIRFNPNNRPTSSDPTI